MLIDALEGCIENVVLFHFMFHEIKFHAHSLHIGGKDVLRLLRA